MINKKINLISIGKKNYYKESLVRIKKAQENETDHIWHYLFSVIKSWIEEEGYHQGVFDNIGDFLDMPLPKKINKKSNNEFLNKILKDNPPDEKHTTYRRWLENIANQRIMKRWKNTTHPNFLKYPRWTENREKIISQALSNLCLDGSSWVDVISEEQITKIKFLKLITK